jgi:hypothetical protein
MKQIFFYEEFPTSHPMTRIGCFPVDEPESIGNQEGRFEGGFL